jgi:hypothetical protein
MECQYLKTHGIQRSWIHPPPFRISVTSQSQDFSDKTKINNLSTAKDLQAILEAKERRQARSYLPIYLTLLLHLQLSSAKRPLLSSFFFISSFIYVSNLINCLSLFTSSLKYLVIFFSLSIYFLLLTRRYAVTQLVEALCCKPEGCGFDCR